MPQKITCPFHTVQGKQERTPSLAIYPDGYHCFSCGKSGPLSDINTSIKVKPKKVDNIEEKVAYIKNLPKYSIRGLHLHADDSGYYLLWADDSYYVKRYYQPKRIKYIGPAGHRRPIYVPQADTGKRLFVVEGELNALSMAEVWGQDTIASPGGVDQFRDKDNLQFYSKFDTVYLCVDKDPPGVLSAFDTKQKLQGKVKNIFIELWERDMNDWLQYDGAEKLKAELKRRMEAIPKNLR